MCCSCFTVISFFFAVTFTSQIQMHHFVLMKQKKNLKKIERPPSVCPKHQSSAAANHSELQPRLCLCVRVHFERARACLPVSLTRSLIVNPQSFRPSCRWIMRSSPSPNADLAAAVLILTCHRPPRLPSVRPSVHPSARLADRDISARQKNAALPPAASRGMTQSVKQAVGQTRSSHTWQLMQPVGSRRTARQHQHCFLIMGAKITCVSELCCFFSVSKEDLLMLRAFKMQIIEKKKKEEANYVGS